MGRTIDLAIATTATGYNHPSKRKNNIHYLLGQAITRNKIYIPSNLKKKDIKIELLFCLDTNGHHLYLEPDLDNMCKLIIDELQKFGFYDNDRQVIELKAKKRRDTFNLIVVKVDYI